MNVCFTIFHNFNLQELIEICKYKDIKCNSLERKDVELSLLTYLYSFSSIFSEFPYRNKYYEDDEKIKLFCKLKTLNLQEKNFYKRYDNITQPNIKLPTQDYHWGKDNYRYLFFNPQDWKCFNLSDLFNDEWKVKCSFGDNPSPESYFNANKNVIIQNMINKNSELTKDNIREEIYSLTTECSVNNPLIIKYFIQLFGARKILDMSTGWGDRLIGSMTCDIDLYRSCDPNKNLFKGYNEIIQLFREYSPNKNAEYKIIQDGFQNIILEEKYDLMYSSPPYFDYEIYSDEKEQSINFATTEEEWLNKFIIFSMEKIIDALKYKGHIVMYFSQGKNHSYIEKWMKWMKNNKNLIYKGNIFYGSTINKKHPIFVFQKVI